MPPYLRVTPITLEDWFVTPRLIALVALGALACGGRGGSPATAPQALPESLAQFMSAVKANDLDRMKALWGTERGPASGWMKSGELKQRLTVLQIYLNHVGYRVIEGPLPVPNKDDRRIFRVELQRATSCTVVVPIELAHAKDGHWLVVGTDLAAVGNPAEPCKR